MSRKIAFTIFLQPYSKANSRILSIVAGRPRSIKSKEALHYEAQALRQIPPAARVQLNVPVRVTIRIFYKTERPDLDESLLLDVLQDRYITRKTMIGGKLQSERTLVQKGCYTNDRLVREKHIFHGIDKQHPRAEIEIEPIEPEPSK